mmetsp:Transcript_3122/g.7332  ORF Transcript_3122/g.7332 Transcript_3122/m.7332 type:complete len:82 (-) Transcript_3122:1705-1950(-)
MEKEVESLLRASQGLPGKKEDKRSSKLDVEEMYAKVRMALDDGGKSEDAAALSREAFWREMEQTDDSFQTISRFFAKDVIE